MKLEEIFTPYRYEYNRKCNNCGKEIVVLCKKYESYADYVEAYVKCSCGEYLEFVLPAN